MNEPTTQGIVVTNPFLSTLLEIRTGRGLIEAGEELVKLVAAVRDTGKGGKITFEMRIEPGDHGADSHLLVRDKITTTIPQRERSATIFYASDDNTLQRQDPRQRTLEFLRTVPAPPPAAPLPVQ